MYGGEKDRGSLLLALVLPLREYLRELFGSQDVRQLLERQAAEVRKLLLLRSWQLQLLLLLELGSIVLGWKKLLGRRRWGLLALRGMRDGPNFGVEPF